MDLFQVVNGVAFPSTHALLIEPFKTIWESDASEGNQDSIKIFTYIELLCSPKKSNPFSGIPIEERPDRVKKEVWGEMPPPLESVTDIILAVEKYRELLLTSSPSYSFLMGALESAERLKDQLRKADFDERTKGGSMVIKPKDVSNALKDTYETIQMLELLRTKVDQEITEDTKTRNNRVIGDYER